MNNTIRVLTTRAATLQTSHPSSQSHDIAVTTSAEHLYNRLTLLTLQPVHIWNDHMISHGFSQSFLVGHSSAFLERQSHFCYYYKMEVRPLFDDHRWGRFRAQGPTHSSQCIVGPISGCIMSNSWQIFVMNYGNHITLRHHDSRHLTGTMLYTPYNKQ